MIFRLPKRTQPDIQPDIQPDSPKLPPTAPARRSGWWFCRETWSLDREGQSLLGSRVYH